MRGIFGSAFVIWLIVVIAIAVGWIANIIKLIHMGIPADLAHTSILFILRLIGIIAVPLGSFLGLFY